MGGDSTAQIYFMRQVLALMDANPMVERCAPFSHSHCLAGTTVCLHACQSLHSMPQWAMSPHRAEGA